MRHSCARPFFLFAALSLAGCQSVPDTDPRYRPPENVLEVIAVLRRHVTDDTYRFEPARDFSGRNVYRSSLIRLENIERVHEGSLRAGHMDGVIAFAKGRALERLRAFDIAAQHYRRAAEIDAMLRDEATRSARVCEALHEADQIGIDLDDPDQRAQATPLLSEPDAVLRQFDARSAGLERLLEDNAGSHYEAVIREELEHVEQECVEFFQAARMFSRDGEVRAVAEVHRLVARHRDSKNANRHLLVLADLYAELAGEYVKSHPPESLLFNPARFEELVDAASRLYQRVAGEDGTTEKLEAARRLEAFLAFALRVDRDRFTP